MTKPELKYMKFLILKFIQVKEGGGVGLPGVPPNPLIYFSSPQPFWRQGLVLL